MRRLWMPALALLSLGLGSATAKPTDEHIEDLKSVIPAAKQAQIFERYQAIVRGEWDELDLTFCNLREVPVEAICHLQDKLAALYLANNFLTEIPEGVCDCLASTLKKIDLSDNMIETLPDAFDKLKQASWLRLSNNRFTAFPDPVYSMRKLRRLVLSGNQISLITENIAFLDGLKVLNLGNNKIVELPEEFIELKNARVGLYGNPLKVPPLKVAIRGMKEVTKWFEGQANEREAKKLADQTLEDMKGLMGEDEDEEDTPAAATTAVASAAAAAAPATTAAPAATPWAKHYSDKYKRYYWFNSQTNESRWTDPALDAPAAPAPAAASGAAGAGDEEEDLLENLIAGAVQDEDPGDGGDEED